MAEDFSSKPEPSGSKVPSLKFTWRQCHKAPYNVWQQPVALNGKIYVLGEVVVSKGIFKSPDKFFSVVEYDPKSDAWNALPAPKVSYTTVTTFKEQLIIVGGKIGEKCTTQIQSFNFTSGQWEEVYNEMPVALCGCCVIGYQDHLIVACGSSDTCVKQDVYILNTLTGSWSSGTSLPPEATPHDTHIIGEDLYMIGTSVINIFRCHAPTLISGSGAWDVLPSSPILHSSSVVFQDNFLFFGGSATVADYPSDKEVFSDNIYCYSGSEWVVVGNLPKKADSCLCVVVGNELSMLRWSANKHVYQATITAT